MLESSIYKFYIQPGDWIRLDKNSAMNFGFVHCKHVFEYFVLLSCPFLAKYITDQRKLFPKEISFTELDSESIGTTADRRKVQVPLPPSCGGCGLTCASAPPQKVSSSWPTSNAINHVNIYK